NLGCHGLEGRLQEQRIALGEIEQRGCKRIIDVTDIVAHDLAYLFAGEWSEREEAALATDSREHVGDRNEPRFRIAIACENSDARRAKPSRDERQQLEGGHIRHVKIIEDEEQRCAPCTPSQERAHRLEQLESIARG